MAVQPDGAILLLRIQYPPSTKRHTRLEAGTQSHRASGYREASSLMIAQALDSLGARVVGYDPVASKAASRLLLAMKVVFDPYEALKGAHVGVVVTEWEEIHTLDLKRAAALMEAPKVLVDGRNALDPGRVGVAGMRYRGFGRG